MSGYDGSIRINTKIDTDGYIKGLQKMYSNNRSLTHNIEQTEKKIASLQKELNDLKLAPLDNKSISSLRDKIGSAEEQAGKLKSQLEKVGETRVPTREYIEVKRYVEQCRRELDKLLQREEKQKAIGNVKTNSASWKKLQYDIEEARNSLKYAKADMKSMQLDGTQMQSGTQTEEYARIKQQFDKTNSSLEVYKQQLKDALNAESRLRQQKLSNKSAQIEGLNGKLIKYNEQLDKANAKQNNISSSIARMGNRAAKHFRQLIGQTKKSGSAIDGLSQKISRMSRFWLSMGASLIFFSMASKALEGLSSIMTVCVRRNKQLVSSLAQIKGNLLTAFMPIWQSVQPALNAMAAAIAKVTGYLAQFISLLFGKTVKSSQQAAESISNEAAALNGAAEAAKDAAKATDDYLGSFDMIDKLPSTSDDSSNTGNGNGNSGIGYQYEDIDANSKVSEFVEKLKEAWENADFTEIGEILGQKLTDALAGINWENIKDQAKKIAKSIATFINGFIEGTDWTVVGTTIAECINTAVAFAKELITDLDFSAIGTAIGELIVAALNGIDWDDIDTTFTEFCKGIADAINAAMSTPGLWSAIGTTVGNFINTAINGLLEFGETFEFGTLASGIATAVEDAFGTVEWDKVGETIGTYINGALEFIITFVTEMPWGDIVDAIEEVVTTAFDTIDFGDLATVILGAIVIGQSVSGMATMLGGVATWVTGTVLPAITTKISTILGGTSIPGNVKLALAVAVAVAGYKIGEKYYEKVTGEKAQGGIKDLLFGDVSWEEIGEAISDGAVVDISLTPLLRWMAKDDTITTEEVIDAMELMIEDVVQGFKDLGKKYEESIFFSIAMKIVETAGEFAGKVSAWWTDVKSKVEAAKSLVAEIKATIATKWEDLKAGWESLTGNIKDKVADFKAKVASKWEDLKDKWQGLTGNVKDKTADFKAKVATKWADMKDKWKTIYDNFKGKTADLKFKIGSKWSDFKATIKNWINNMIRFLNSNLVGKLNSLFKVTIPNNKATKFLGINGSHQIIKIPNIPMLATGAVIPANNPFLAVLGDQKSGTNIETPLKTMLQAFQMALDAREDNNSGGSEEIRLIVELDGEKIHERVVKVNKKKTRATGTNPMTA